jgi:hypothetical protein
MLRIKNMWLFCLTRAAILVENRNARLMKIATALRAYSGA